MSKYFLKDGRSVRQYIRDEPNHIPLGTIMYRILTKNMSPDDAISEPVRAFNTKLFVHGKSFRQYCKEHGLSYPNMHIKYTNRYYDMTPEEFFEKELAGTLKKSRGMKGYCESKGYNYWSLYSNWHIFHMDKCTFKQYVAKWEAGEHKRFSCVEYCKQKGYTYTTLYNRYRRTKHPCTTFKDFIIYWEKQNGYSSEAA